MGLRMDPLQFAGLFMMRFWMEMTILHHGGNLSQFGIHSRLNYYPVPRSPCYKTSQDSEDFLSEIIRITAMAAAIFAEINTINN